MFPKRLHAIVLAVIAVDVVICMLSNQHLRKGEHTRLPGEGTSHEGLLESNNDHSRLENDDGVPAWMIPLQIHAEHMLFRRCIGTLLAADILLIPVECTAYSDLSFRRTFTIKISRDGINKEEFDVKLNEHCEAGPHLVVIKAPIWILAKRNFNFPQIPKGVGVGRGYTYVTNWPYGAPVASDNPSLHEYYKTQVSINGDIDCTFRLHPKFYFERTEVVPEGLMCVQGHIDKDISLYAGSPYMETGDGRPVIRGLYMRPVEHALVYASLETAGDKIDRIKANLREYGTCDGEEQ